MEEIIESVGSNDKYQRIIIAILLGCSPLATIYTLQISYLTKYPDFLVRRINSKQNFTIQEYNSSICDSSIYEIKKYPNTSIDNWSYNFDLYCNRNFYNLLITSAIFIGGITSAVIISPFPDKVGRLKIYKSFFIGVFICHLNFLFSIGPIHIILINLVGGFISFIYSLSFVIITEYLTQSITGKVFGLFSAIYPIFGILMGFYFLTINNYKLLFLFTTLLSGVILYLILKYMTESPLWLALNGEKEEFIKVLDKIAMINNKETNWENFKKYNMEKINEVCLKKEITKIKEKTIFDILTLKSQRKNLIIHAYLWLASSINFFGIILNLKTMKGGFFANSISAFIGEAISELFAGIFSDKLGRLPCMKYPAFIGSISFIIYLYVPDNFKFIFVFGAMLGNASMFAIISIYTPEVFPTPIRGLICGYTNIFARIGPLLLPYLTEILGDGVNWIFIIGGFGCGIVCFFIEETLGKELPNIIPEDEELKDNFLSGDENVRESYKKINHSYHVKSMKSGRFKI